MMRLDVYVCLKKMTYEELAKKIGCSRNYLNSIATGQVVPGKHLAKAIELATEGEVTVAELLGKEKI